MNGRVVFLSSVALILLGLILAVVFILFINPLLGFAFFIVWDIIVVTLVVVLME